MSLKYRMWTGHKMLLPTDPAEQEQIIACIGQQMCYNNVSVIPLPHNHLGDGSVFMQYTGIEDVDTQEICEGDVLAPDWNEIVSAPSIPKNYRGYVKKDGGAFWVDNGHGLCFYLYQITWKWVIKGNICTDQSLMDKIKSLKQ